MAAAASLAVKIALDGVARARKQLEGLEGDLQQADRAARELDKRKASVTVTADTSRARAAMDAVSGALGKLDGRRANASVGVDTGDARVKVERIQAALKEFGRQKSEAKTDVEIAAAAAKIKVLQHELNSISTRQARSELGELGFSFDSAGGSARHAGGGFRDADGDAQGLIGSLRDLNIASSAAGNIVGVLKVPALITALGLAAQAASAAAAGIVGLTAALAPLAGLAAAGGNAMLALAQGAGTFALATGGVKDALKEQLTNQVKSAAAATSGAQQQRAAAQAIINAQDGVQSALQRVGDAERALAGAQRDARAAQGALATARVVASRGIEDMRAALARATASEARAVLTLKDARAALARALAGPDPAKIARAHDTLASAATREQRAVIALTDARTAYETLLRGPDPLDVADAQDRVTDATRGEARAVIALTKARERAAAVAADPRASVTDKADAALDLADAENAIGDATRDRQRAEKDLQKIQAGPSDAEKAKARLDIRDAELGVADATRDRTDAEKALRDAQAGPSATEKRQALLDFRDAQDDLAESTRERTRLERDLAAAERRGVEGSSEVVAARERIAVATERVADAQRDLARSRNDVTKALAAVSAAQLGARDAAAGAATGTEKLNQKMAALPPAAQEFVRALIGLKPKLDELRNTAAAGLFPGVVAGLQSAMRNFTPLRNVIGLTATAFGRLAERAGDLVGGKAFGQDLQTVGASNARVITTLGTGALHLANAFRHITVAAAPLTEWLAKLATGWARSAEQAAAAGRASGALAGFFEQTRGVVARLVTIAESLGTAFLNIGKAAAPLGNDILNALTKAAKGFAAWTDSTKGENALKQYFDDAKPAVFEMGRLVGDVTKAFFKLGAGDQVAPLIKQVRTELLPALVTLVDETTKAFGPVLIEALTNIVRLIAEIASGPVLAGFIKLIGDFAGALAKLLDNNPMLAQFVGIMWGLSTVLGIVKFAGAASGVTALAKALPGLWAAIGAGSLASLGPIALIVLGIAALAAGFIIAYKNSEKFRDIVNGALRAVGDTAKWFGGAISDAFGAIRPIVEAAIGVIGAIGEKVVERIIAVPTRYFEAGKWIIETIVSGLRTVVSALATVGAWLVGAIIDSFNGVKAYFRNRGEDVIHWIVGGIRTVIGALANVGTWLWGEIKKSFDNVKDFFRNRGIDVIEWIVGGVRTVIGALAGVGNWLWQEIKKAFDGAKDFFRNRGIDVIGWIVDGVRTVVGALAGFGGWLVEEIKKAFDGAKDFFANRGKDVIGWIVGGMKSGLDGIKSFVNDIIGAINWLLDKIGVDKIPLMKRPAAEGGKPYARGGVYQAEGLARGGAFARTGGIVSSPITLMGEEAPRHPEYVIPSNPAYRDRARGLLGQAAGAIGMAAGGQFVSTSYGPPWGGIQGTGVTADGTDLRPAKQAYGVAVDPNVIALGSMLSIQPNPFGREGKFKAFDTGGAIDGRRIDFYDWRGRDSQLGWGTRNVNVSNVTKGGGILDTIGSAISGAANAVGGILGDLMSKGAGLVLDRLPGVGDLPDYLKGVGRFMLDQAGGYIKDKVSGILDGLMVGGDGGMKATGGRLQLPATFTPTHATSGLGGYPAIDVFAKPGTKVLSPVDGTVSRLGGRSPAAGAYAGLGGPFGWSMYLDGGGRSYFLTHFGARSVGAGDHVKYGQVLGLVGDYPGGVPDHIHEGATGMMKGGIYGSPFVGSYATGGTLPADGYYYGHQGETVTPAATDRTGPLVHIERMEVRDAFDEELWARRLALRLQTAS